MQALAVCGITDLSNNSNKHLRVFVPEVGEHPRRYNQGAVMYLDDHCLVSSAEEAIKTQAVNSVGPKQPVSRLEVLLLEEDLHRIGYDKGFGVVDPVRRVHRLEVKGRSNLRLATTEEVVEAVMRTGLDQAECMTRPAAAGAVVVTLV
jgi:hypothetical protein